MRTDLKKKFIKNQPFAIIAYKWSTACAESCSSYTYVNFQHFTSSVTKVTLRSNSDQKMASRLSLTEVLEAVLDDDSDDSAYLRMRAVKEKMKAYLLTLDSTT